MFNKKNRFSRFFAVFLLSLFLSLALFSFSSQVLASDTFGTNLIEENIDLSNQDPRSMASKIINIALGFLGIVAVGIVIFGGFIWMTAEGNDEKVDKAKRILKSGVIGLVIVLASWGVASFVLNKLGGVTGTAGFACEDGQIRDCGCDGTSVCVDSSWGSCVGSSCLPGGHGSSCSAGLAGVCQPDNTFCNTGLTCDNNCTCVWPGEGAPCGEVNNNVCTADDNDCSNSNLTCDPDNCVCVSDNDDENNYSELGDPCSDGGSCSAENPTCNPNHGLICSPNSCTCVGHPVITGFSPVGGFCNNNSNTPCSNDLDCGTGGSCNFTTPNTSGGNLFTILGYNFGTYDADKSKVKFIKGGGGFNCGDNINYNNYSYKTVEIGNQCWFAENLKTDQYNDYSSIYYPGINAPEWLNNPTGAYAFYNNDINNPVTAYGYFYNWYAVNSGKLCPDGWEVPSDNQWYLLESFIEPSISPSATGWRGSEVAGKLKATSGWGSFAGTDNYGFTALRGGLRNVNGSFPTLSTGAWWSRTETGSGAYIRYLADYNNNISRMEGDKRIGASVRCVYAGGGSSVSLVAKNPKEVNNYCDNSWTNTSITVALPDVTPFVALGSSPDDLDVEVITGEEKSYKISDNPNLELVKWNMISRPGICAMSSASGSIGDNIIYYGINLNQGKAYFGNSINNVLGYSVNNFASSTAGFASVPSLSNGKTSTFVQKTINNVPVYSNFLDFTKIAEAPQGPSVSIFDPTSGPSGQYVSIIGSGFNAYKGDSSVYFRKENDNTYSKEASFNFPEVCVHSVWSDNKIIVKVPNNIDDGNYNLVIKIGNWPEIISNELFIASSSMSLSPGLCKISPASGPQKTSVSLWGEYFGTTSKAYFSNNRATNDHKIDPELGADKMSATVPNSSVTGPVKIYRDSLPSNSLNFTVASCGTNSDCDSGFCCLPGTLSAGACVNNKNECFSGTPSSSVFQWGFTTGFNVNPIPTSTDTFSCASYNFCPTEKWTCPNTPGLCSPYNATGQLVETGDCKYDCSGVDFCKSPNSCSYDSNIDKCVLKNGSNNYECSLSKEVKYDLGYGEISKNAVCQKYVTINKSYYEITVDTVCPTIGGVKWTLVPGTNNKCIDVATFGSATSTCALCPTGVACEKNPASPASSLDGVCVSPEICSGNSTCYNDDKCKKTDVSSCQCCCEISANTSSGNPACCAPLSCAGTCGQSANSGATNTDFGLCSGCKISTTTSTADRDLACNCTTNSGQYCEINNQNPTGACLDCTSLQEGSCKEHSAACCWDDQKDVCRGGASDASVWGTPVSPGIGYCPYYNCDPSNVTQCYSIVPEINGQYPSIPDCQEGCSKNCSQLNSNTQCGLSSACCWDQNSQACLAGDKFSNGRCVYYSCTNAPNACTQSVNATGNYLSQSVCDNNCSKTSSGFGGACYTYPNIDNACAFGLCNMLTCLQDNGDNGDNDDVPESCGTCCCSPGANDKCGLINDNLTCVADKGACTGNSRGLCCGCSSDSECSLNGIEPTQVGCGIDTCCLARPQISKDVNKLAQLDVSPEHRSEEVCRNTLVEINFDQRMDPLTLDGNILLLEENISGTCSVGTYKISQADINNLKDKNIFAKLKNIFTKTKNSIAGLFGKTAIASPDANKTYCAVLGVVDFIHDASQENKTTVYFKPNSLLKPETRYFVVVKGDEELNSFSGVKASSGVGMNGSGYYNDGGYAYNPGDWEESSTSSAIQFNEVSYPNSYVWDFVTMDVNNSGSGICEIDYIKVSPESYLFQTTKNDINENDTDPNHSTFNSVRDKDVQYLAQAYSKDNQILIPSDDYNWTWNWQISNNQILEFNNGVSGWAADGEKKLVQVKDGITDGKSNISATIDVVAGSKVSAGDGLSNSATAYVLICKNPWPAINESTGLWYPWQDSGSFGQFNYEFYYCRDFGSDDESDDLPAFLNDLAIVKGESLIRVCSNAPSQTCSTNSNCPSGGICLSSFLKETYFFREIVDRFVKSVSVSDKMTNGTLTVNWESGKNLVTSYNVYYKLSSASTWLFKPFKLADCQSSPSKYTCSMDLTGLTNGQSYDIKITALHNGLETNPSLTYSAVPTFPIPVFVNCGDPLHYNGYNYKTVLIGTQCWLAEDLRTTSYNNNNGISKNLNNSNWSSTTNGAYAVYPYTLVSGINSEAEMISAYGILYNWYAVNSGNLCPLGWHVSSENEFIKLRDFVSIISPAGSAGNKIKSTRVDPMAHPRWKSNTSFINTDIVGFTSLPGGQRNASGNFTDLETINYIWLADSYNANNAKVMRMSHSSGGLLPINYSKNFGLSVRCIKN